MPGFTAACDHCRVLFHAHVYGFRAPRRARCPLCGREARGRRRTTVQRLEEEGYRWVSVRYERGAWVVLDEQGEVLQRKRHRPRRELERTVAEDTGDTGDPLDAPGPDWLSRED